jgi:TolB protein
MTGKTTAGLSALGLLIGCAIYLVSAADRAAARNKAAIFRSWPNQAASHAPAPVINGGLPEVSPDGLHIAFVSNRAGNDDLFLISTNGSGEMQLTRTPEHESPEGWAGNGKQVLFSVFSNDTSRLYSIDRKGIDQRQIGSVSGRAPTLSPDGKRLLYIAGTWTAMRLMVSALDGSNAQPITDGSSIAWNSHWSPDGKRIAFTGRNEPKGELAVFVMNADGSASHQVTHIAAEEGGAQWPVWSPDGRQIAIQVNKRTQKNSSHIWVVNVVTGEAHLLAAHDQPYVDETPSWFPDGKRIAFQSNRTGRMEIWVMNVDGSGQRQVTGL